MKYTGKKKQAEEADLVDEHSSEYSEDFEHDSEISKHDSEIFKHVEVFKYEDPSDEETSSDEANKISDEETSMNENTSATISDEEIQKSNEETSSEEEIHEENRAVSGGETKESLVSDTDTMIRARFEHLFLKAFDFMKDNEGLAMRKLKELSAALSVNKENDKEYLLNIIRFVLGMYEECVGGPCEEDVMEFVRLNFELWRLKTDVRLLSYLATLSMKPEDIDFFVARFHPTQKDDGILAQLFCSGVDARTGFRVLDVIAAESRDERAVQVRHRQLQRLASVLQAEFYTDSTLIGTLRPSEYLSAWTRKLYDAYMKAHVQQQILRDLASMSTGFKSVVKDVEIAESVSYCANFLSYGN